MVHYLNFPIDVVDYEVEVVEAPGGDGIILRSLEVLKGSMPEYFEPPDLIPRELVHFGSPIPRVDWKDMQPGERTIVFFRDGEVNDYVCRDHLPIRIPRLQGGYPIRPIAMGPFELFYEEPSVLAGRDGLGFAVDYLRASLSLAANDEPDVETIIRFIRAVRTY